MAAPNLSELGFCEINLQEVEITLLGTVAAGLPIEAIPQERTPETC